MKKIRKLIITPIKVRNIGFFMKIFGKYTPLKRDPRPMGHSEISGTPIFEDLNF